MGKGLFLKVIIIMILTLGSIVFIRYNTQMSSEVEVRISVGYQAKSEIAQDSKVIVEGKVEKIVEINRNKSIPEIDVTIKVDNIYKGSPKNKNEVIVRTSKPYSRKEVPGQYPSFQKNEKVLLFLSEDYIDIASKLKKYYIVTGVYQGKYTYNDEKKQYIMNRGNEIEVYNKDNLKEEIELENKIIKESASKEM